MKFILCFKTPDVMDGIKREAANIAYPHLDDKMMYHDVRLQAETEMYKLAHEYVQYDEVLQVEFDTVTNTATVLKAKY